MSHLVLDKWSEGVEVVGTKVFKLDKRLSPSPKSSSLTLERAFLHGSPHLYHSAIYSSAIWPSIPDCSKQQVQKGGGHPKAHLFSKGHESHFQTTSQIRIYEHIIVLLKYYNVLSGWSTLTSRLNCSSFSSQLGAVDERLLWETARLVPFKKVLERIPSETR